MNRITVTLKNGKNIEFQTEQSDLFSALSHAYKSTPLPFSYGDEKQQTVYINKDEVAAAKLEPLTQCTNCGKYVIPDTRDVKVDGKIITTIVTCPSCGVKI